MILPRWPWRPIYIHDRVTSDDVARVVAKATGIPVQSLLKGEKEKLVHVSSFKLAHLIISLCVRRWKIVSVSALLVRTMLLSQLAMLSDYRERVYNLQIDLLLLSFSSDRLVWGRYVYLSSYEFQHLDEYFRRNYAKR